MEKSARNIFIETSIQIERILGRIARKEQIRATLEGAKVSTSSYVWMEFRRTALQAMAYLLTIIRQMRQEGEIYILFSELMKRVAAGTAIGYSRRVLQVASSLCGDNGVWLHSGNLSSFACARDNLSGAQVEEVTMQTRVNRYRVNGKIGSRLKVCGETRLFKEILYEERNEKSETHHLFQNWIKFEFAGNLILTRSTQEHFTKPKMPDITKLVNRIEIPDIELIDTAGIEKALEESGIKIEEVEYLDDGLCKVTLLQLTDEFLTTLDTKDIVPPPETSIDKMHTIFSASQEAFEELEEEVEKYEKFKSQAFEVPKEYSRYDYKKSRALQAFEELEKELEE